MSNALHFETTEGKNIINTANAMADAAERLSYLYFDLGLL